MNRLVRISRYLLPLLVGGLAAGLRLQSGQLGPGLPLLVLAGGLLGGAAALMLESVAAMLGLLQEPAASGQRRRALLQREKETLLRSIKDIELDTALLKLEPEQAAQLAEPLRQRAVQLLRELDQAQLDARGGVEEQIERELARRLGGESSPAEEAP